MTDDGWHWRDRPQSRKSMTLWLMTKGDQDDTAIDRDA